jgi:hypothetical protein
MTPAGGAETTSVRGAQFREHGFGYAFTARTGERKDIGKPRPQLSFQIVAEPLAGAVQPGFHGLRSKT